VFNFIVSGNSEAWEGPQPWNMLTQRFGEYSASGAAALIKQSGGNNLFLERTPTLLMYEWSVNAPNAEIVRFGFVYNINFGRSNVTFSFDEQFHCDQGLVDEFETELQLHDYERSRTHWAIKDGDIPREMLEQLARGSHRDFPYDIVISYASENRGYVKQVADYLKSKNVKLFYDQHQESQLWGRDLSMELEVVYKSLGRYCLMFVSKYYAAKAWPTLERKSAMIRAIQQEHRYILPCRFDDTEIPGLSPNVCYADLNEKEPSELGQQVIDVLRRKRS